ncbi:unnamed protein product [Ectocarpus sp. 13 AM-2016]
MRAVELSAQGGLAFNPPVPTFPPDVVRANHETVDQVDTARQQVEANGDKTLSMVLIETNDEPNTAVLVVVLEGRLASLLRVGQEKENVDIPSDDDEGPHQASVFKVTIDVLPMNEQGDGIVYSATVMVDVKLTRRMLLATFCEAQNWPGSINREPFLQDPVLDENTLEQMVYSGRVRNKTYQAIQRIQGTGSVYGQCRISRDQEQHAAQLFKVRLKVEMEAFSALTAPLPDENSPAPANTESICWPEQEEVAKRLFDRTNAVLGNQSMTEFSGVEFMVLTPAFQTLQQQTINRLVESGLVPEDKAASDCVIMYTKSAKHDQLFERFRTRVLQNPRILFVIVADECHNGCTHGGAHNKYVNDENLHHQSNFVLLGVSATPYNCLTSKSRVDESNVIEWFDADHPRGESTYRSMEYYLRTISFTPDPSACELHVKVLSPGKHGNPTDIRVDIRNKPFTAPNEIADALSAEIGQCMAISYHRKKGFVLRNTSTSSRLRLENNETSILRKLGFTEQLPLELAPGSEECASGCWEIGNQAEEGGRSLEDQRIRSDLAFQQLRSRFYSKFGRRGSRRRKGYSIPINPWTWVALHDGHLMLAEYLFSLVCLSMFRQEGRTMRMKSPENPENTETFLVDLVDEACVRTFTEKTQSVCAGTGSCDITIVMDFTYMSAARDELNRNSHGDSSHDDTSCLRYILREKLRASAVAETTSEEFSWFNETDRVLRDLLRGDSDRGHGRMVVMRVYENEEQLSMQHCLRHAVVDLGLTYSGHPLFSVVCDNGDTNLSQGIEGYFRDSFNLRPDGEEGCSTLSHRMRELRNSPASRNTSLSYEDLLNVPMILILCEKGRMGDTFPHSLGCFDLRLRVAGCFSSVEQELGRLCRYPKFRRIDGSGASCKDAARLRGREALSRKLVVKVPSPAVPLVDTWWQLDDALDDAFARAAQVGANTIQDLEESVFPLPTALVPVLTMDKLVKAIGEHRMTGAPISKCIRMQKMDLHMIGSTSKKQRPITDAENNKLHDYLSYSPGKHHFDNRRRNDDRKDPRRLILSAECQVGKTGAYLEYLAMLTRAATGSSPRSEIVPCPPPLAIGELWPKHVLDWLLPYWRAMVKVSPLAGTYNHLLASKYTKGIATERVHLVAKSCKHGGLWNANYADRLKNVCGEHVQSAVGQGRIENLRQATLEAPFDTAGNPRPTRAGYESLKQAINWDGRFETDFGVQLCTCEEGQCTCPDVTGSFGMGLKLCMANLAQQAEGEHEGVDARWETSPEENEGETRTTTSNEHEPGVAAKQPPSSWKNGVQESELTPDTFRHRLDIEGSRPLTLRSSIPNSGGVQNNFDTPTEGSRWIFTPSYNRATPGSRQALLDRSAAFLHQDPGTSPDVGSRVHINVLVVRPEQFDEYRRHFGHEYVVLEMPSQMPCWNSDVGYCTPEEGGIGYARHFIQQWCSNKRIPFAWMLDDNVQMCHELDVNTGRYGPCGFTHVMDSLERVLLLHQSRTIDVRLPPHQSRTNDDMDSAPQSVSKFAKKHLTCPPDLESLRRGQHGDGATTNQMHPTSVEDFCGKPNHYGLLGISRHGPGGENRRDIQNVTPFDVNHSVYSFCLLNVQSTVEQKAYYPLKRYWEDIEFNHIVDEKGLAVCMFRKFSHCKKDLQPRHTLWHPTLAFEHREIDLNELQTTFENIPGRWTMVIPSPYLDSLLEYLSRHVLNSIQPAAIVYPSDEPIGGGNERKVVLVGSSYDLVPAVPEQQSPMIELQTSPDSKIALLVLLGGLESHELGLLGRIIKKQIIEKRNFEQAIVLTRLPRNGNTGTHIGTWLQRKYTLESNVQVQAEIVLPRGQRAGYGLLVLTFSLK